MKKNPKYVWPTIRFLNKASAAQTEISKEQAAFYKTLTDSYSKAFAGQQAIISSITTAWAPILAAGITQYGFSAAQDTALRTQASEGTAANYAAANKAVNETLAARGGGNVMIPSGAEASIQASIAGAAAESESEKQLNITNTGYQIGRANYLAASNALSGAAELENPAGFAGTANQSGNDAFNSATTIYNQGNTLGMIGGMVGGIAGSFLGPIGSSIGSKVGGLMSGSGTSTPSFTSTGGYGM